LNEAYYKQKIYNEIQAQGDKIIKVKTVVLAMVKAIIEKFEILARFMR
jgi:hypothetical protein